MKNKRLAACLLSGLGTGYLRPAPGTWGSAGLCGVALGALALLGSGWGFQAVLIALAVVSTIINIAFGRDAEEIFGRKDPSHVTIDEWAGQAVTLLVLPLGTSWSDHLIAVGVAFVAFRVFDIIKFPPCRSLEKLPHGYGVVSDDLLAGVYANLVCQLVLRFGFGL